MFAEAPEKYDMILMDIQMPEMDGYEATRRIRAIEAEHSSAGNLKKQIPIIAMTANVFREDIEKCLEAGMDSHIGKPLDFHEVMDKLRRYLPK
jgi:CheY-like chemotaxis protein